MAASEERRGGGDPLPKDQKGGGDRGIISTLGGYIGLSGGQVKTPTEDYNYQVRNEFGSYWLEVVDNVVSFQTRVSHRARDVQLNGCGSWSRPQLLFRMTK